MSGRLLLWDLILITGTKRRERGPCASSCSSLADVGLTTNWHPNSTWSSSHKNNFHSSRVFFRMKQWSQSRWIPSLNNACFQVFAVTSVRTRLGQPEDSDDLLSLDFIAFSPRHRCSPRSLHDETTRCRLITLIVPIVPPLQDWISVIYLSWSNRPDIVSGRTTTSSWEKKKNSASFEYFGNRSCRLDHLIKYSISIKGIGNWVNFEFCKSYFSKVCLGVLYYNSS